MPVPSFKLAVGALIATLASAQTSSPSVDRVFRFTHTDGEQAFQEIATVVRSMTDIRNATFATSPRGLSVSGTPSQVALAEWLFYELDRPPDRQAPSREFRVSNEADDVVKVFHLAHTATPQELQEVATSVRSIAEIRRLFTYNAPRVMAVRGTADQIKLADWLVTQLDQSPGPGQREAGPFQMPGGRGEGVRVLFLNHLKTEHALHELAVLVRVLADIRWVMLCNRPKALTVRGSSEQLKFAQWLVNDVSVPLDPSAAAGAPPSNEFRFAGSSDDQVRVFRLSSTRTPQQVQEIAVQVRLTSQVRRIFTYNPGNRIALRGTTHQMALADRLIRELDQ